MSPCGCIDSDAHILCGVGGWQSRAKRGCWRKEARLHHFHLCSPAVRSKICVRIQQKLLLLQSGLKSSAGQFWVVVVVGGSPAADAAADALNILWPEHESSRADGNVAHYSRSSGVSEEERLRSGGFPADVAAGWSGAVPAAGAAPTRDAGQSEWRCSRWSRCSQIWLRRMIKSAWKTKKEANYSSLLLYLWPLLEKNIK